MNEISLARRLTAEFLGTAFLLAVVVGSGIMAERLAGGNTAIALLANAVATGAGLAAIILMFGPVSGSHINPCVTLAEKLTGKMSYKDSGLYVAVQIAGAFVGVAVANLMFGYSAFAVSTKVRTGPEQWLGELVAMFGLIGVVIAVSRRYSIAVTAAAVGAYISAAYWFTSSTSFANPAVTIGRALTDTFTGIRPVDVPAFIVAQVIAAIAAAFFFNWLVPDNAEARA